MHLELIRNRENSATNGWILQLNDRIRQRTDYVGVLSHTVLVLGVVTDAVGLSLGFVWYVVSASRRPDTSYNLLGKVNILFQLLVPPGTLYFNNALC